MAYVTSWEKMGIKKGEEKIKEMIQKMIKKGLSLDLIQDVSGLPQDEIKKLMPKEN